MQKYVVLEKRVGETPLEVAEKWRMSKSPVFDTIPLAYAGRLDPMASGKLLVLIGDECKVQEKYHHLDKAYNFSVLFGVATDTADVLGIIKDISTAKIDFIDIPKVAKNLVGKIELPYPHFSSKTVKGKPLHTWAVEGKLDEIVIPTKQSEIYRLALRHTETKTGTEIFSEVMKKIDTIPPVTDPRKAMGNDFRRPEVRAGWQNFLELHTNDTFVVAHFTCIASSGTYMRTLAEVIATDLGTIGLAYSIHRTKIGHYKKLPVFGGLWASQYR